MSLAGAGAVDDPVVRKGVEFLKATVRPDGSWPIDTNLATWVTTLATNALASGRRKAQRTQYGVPSTAYQHGSTTSVEQSSPATDNDDLPSGPNADCLVAWLL